jgi:hypothetical protein
MLKCDRKEELTPWAKATRRPGKEKLFVDPMARQDQEKKQRKKRSHPVETFCFNVTRSKIPLLP